MLKAAKELGIPNERIIIFNPNGEKAPPGFKQWNDLFQKGESDWVRFDDLQTTSNTPAARLFSSGTTGLPKATDLTHYNLIAEHTLFLQTNPRPWRASRLLCLPFFHAATAPIAFTSTLKDGTLGYVAPRFDPELWFKAHEQFSLTDLVVVPPIAIMAINSPLNKRYSLKSVKVANVGAAPLDKVPQARMQSLIGEETPFTQVWGMTETSCVATRFPWPEKDATGSVGRPLPNLDLKLVDDDGKDISAYGVRGELCVRGPTIVRGYFENPEANKRDWDDEGFFHTGDIAYVEEGTEKWYIVDRKKVSLKYRPAIVMPLLIQHQELIKVRAFQVAPPELEGVLYDHPDITDAAVIGVPADKAVRNRVSKRFTSTCERSWLHIRCSLVESCLSLRFLRTQAARF